MDQFFLDLGRLVLSRWKSRNFALADFPTIAQQALDECPPHKRVDTDKLIREFLLNEDQPHQSHSGFGQPELIVFHHPDFYIQVLFWLDGTTQIHQHEFSGAFHVLQGSSLHSVFEFAERQPVSAHLHLGNLRLKEAVLLETGSTVPIVSGTGCIHSLFHLETPSLTVVIRTHSDPGSSPQFTYLPPHLAIDPFHDDALTTRRCQLMDVLEKTESQDYVALLLSMIETLDFERGYFILQNGFNYLKTLDRWAEVLLAFQKRHGELASGISATLEETAWRDSVVRLRSSIETPEHRYFLALLLNVPTREEILRFIEMRVTGDPIDSVLAWAEDLADEEGFWILDAQFPLDVEVEEAERLSAFLQVLRFFLRGRKGKSPCPAKVLGLFENALAHSALRGLLT